MPTPAAVSAASSIGSATPPSWVMGRTSELESRSWRDAATKDSNYLASETPVFAGRAVAALAADKNLSKKTGRVFSSWGLSDEYNFCDADGGRPHWGRHFAKTYGAALKHCDDAFYEHWVDPAVDAIFGDWP